MTTDERAKLRRDARTVAEVIRMDGHPRLAAMVRDLANDHEALEREHADVMGVVVRLMPRRDGSTFYHVNLAWMESADTPEEALEIVRDTIASVNRKSAPAPASPGREG